MRSAIYYHVDDMLYICMIVMPLPSRAPRKGGAGIRRHVYHRYHTIPRHKPWKTDVSNVWVLTLVLMTEHYSPRCHALAQTRSIGQHIFYPNDTAPHLPSLETFFCNAQSPKKSSAPHSSSSPPSAPSPLPY